MTFAIFMANPIFLLPTLFVADGRVEKFIRPDRPRRVLSSDFRQCVASFHVQPGIVRGTMRDLDDYVPLCVR